MNAGSNIVKITAKTALKGNMLNSVFSSLIVIISTLIFNCISSVVSIFAGSIFSTVFYILSLLFLVFPLVMGLIRYFWRLILGVVDNPISVFYYLSSKNLYLKTLGLLFSAILKTLPVAILLFLPSFFAWLFSKSFLFDLIDVSTPIWSANFTYIFLFLRAIAGAILIVYLLKFYISPILFVADENIDVSEALHMSSMISKRTKLDFIYLFFSFLGWILLSLLVMPMFFTIPYILTSYAVHTRFAIAEYNKHIENSENKEVFPTFVAGA